MIRVLLIDDKRHLDQVHPNSRYAGRVARTFQEGIEALAESVPFDVLYLDHDLGEEGDKTGYGIMCWLEAHVEKLPKIVKVVSSNPPGIKSIGMVLARFYDFDYTTRRWVLESQ